MSYGFTSLTFANFWEYMWMFRAINICCCHRIFKRDINSDMTIMKILFIAIKIRMEKESLWIIWFDFIWFDSMLFDLTLVDFILFDLILFFAIRFYFNSIREKNLVTNNYKNIVSWRKSDCQNALFKYYDWCFNIK